MTRTVALVVLTALLALPAFAELSPTKVETVATVDHHAGDLTRLADQIWSHPETALRETFAAKLLADYAEAQGFRVERGVAEMPTAFVASFGEGHPIVAVLGEFDALPGLSQAVTAERQPIVEGGPGHGCGHNLFGPASLGAALAIKERIAAGELSGTVRFYGTPAEESVGGKIYMVRAGLFADVDVALAWHPSDENIADTASSQAMVDFEVIFRGRAAHAAYDPWNGRSALDAAELFTHGINLMREHVEPSVRMHYVITDGGDVPNVVPAYARVWCWVRDDTHERVAKLLERVRHIVEGAALATEVQGELNVMTGDWEMLVNMAGERLLYANMVDLGPIAFTPEEDVFARALQHATGVPEKGMSGTIHPFEDVPPATEGGSTDVADVSWTVPTLHVSITTAALGAPWHAWPTVAASGSSIGHKGMLYAAKVLATTMVDLYDPDTLAAVRREFATQTAGTAPYQSFLPPGPPPVPAATDPEE